MITFDSKTSRFLARMGSRGTFGQAVYDYAKDGNDFFAVSADLSYPSGFERIRRDYPEKVVEVGIAEQNLIGVAAGLARTGIPVVATSWAMFASARAVDQARNFLGFMQANVKLVGLDSGFVQSKLSYSHANPPDIAIMRALPGITILSPCDGVETYKAVWSALEHNGPVYIRLTGSSLMPIVHKDPAFDFVVGKSIRLRTGSDVAIIATGNIVKNSLDAADILEGQGMSVTVIDMHTIEPLDCEMLSELSGYPLLVTVEEHLLHGGLGSAVAEYYADKQVRPRHIMLGVDNHYPAPGRIKYTEEANGLTAEQIAGRIIGESGKSKAIFC